ncbi:MAG: EF-hand domain-containing protein, partial [Clostridia bacterium]|nr:EF-hand domain-containing protein [Clostridia bacterium]
MGADNSNNVNSSVGNDEILLKQLSPNSIFHLKQEFSRNPTGFHLGKKQAMSILKIGQREIEILFDYFDMDGNGEIDEYELTCALAMIVHSSLDLRSELIFKLYDFNSDNYLSRSEVMNLIKCILVANNKPLINSEIEERVDEIMKVADLDMDKKLSLREFQLYSYKNREMFACLDKFEKLISKNPIGAPSTMDRPGARRNLKKNKDELSNEDEGDNQEDTEEDNNNESYNDKNLEEDLVNIGEDDPDLVAELKKADEANEKFEKNENYEKIKQGIEYGNGFAEEEHVAGDEFGAVKPWMTNVVNTVPSNYKPSKLDGKTPDAQLELEFVHGYRCHDTRNNLKYTKNGNFVYHTAAVGIVYNKEENTQQIYNEHFDDITALAIHPNKKYVATGEVGPYPLISIWDVETCQALVHIREPLQKGINHLAFSRDGKYLCATAADDDHNIAVFDWKKGQAEDLSTIKNKNLRVKKNQAQCKGPVYGYAKGGRANILGVCFNKDGKKVACCAVKEVNVFTVQSGKMKKTKCTGLKGSELTSIMCCGYLKDKLLCGSINGKLLICSGTQFTKSQKAHKTALNTLYIKSDDSGFITGGGDGIILKWNNKFKVISKIDIKTPEVHSLNPKIRSVCENENGNILVGTRGGEILEVEDENPNVYLRGHWDKELWGLCADPKKNQFYTVGQDKLLAVWDIKNRKMINYCIIEKEGMTIACSPKGDELAIGCKEGELYIYDAEKLKQKYIKKETVRKSISDVKYSPDGSFLAVGGIDKDTDGFMHIFIYDCNNQYKTTKKLKGHQARVTHIDWSADGEYIQSNSAAYELLYHSIDSGTQITNISSLRDVDWYTWTCVLGWPVQGIWPDCASGDDINSCDIDKTKRVIVTSDDYSKIKLFRYPSPVQRAAYNQYNGHSSHVTTVRFMSDNKYVISTGGNDKAIFQFKFSFDSDQEEENIYEGINEKEENPDLEEENGYFKEEEMGGGDEFGANKPWIGELQKSSPNIQITKDMGKPPKENINRLKYVFGYRAFDSRMNIKYTKDENKIVYTTAALGIVLDKKTNKQRYFTNHEEDIVSLCIHPNKYIVATGQMAAKGKAKFIDLYVWNVNNLPEKTNVLADDRQRCPNGVSNLKGALLRAIRILQFSPDGKKLLGNGQDDQNSIALWDTSNLNRITLINTTKVDAARVLDVVWVNNEQFVTVGPKHIKYFKVKGRNITSTKGSFGKNKVEPLCSVCSAFGKIFTGTTKGNLISWTGAKAGSVTNICKSGAVFCLYYNEKQKLMFTGGADGVIIAYDNGKLNEKYRIELKKITKSPTNCGIRAMDVNSKGEMVIGTKGGEIVEISLQTKTLIKTLMKSHYDKELWGLTVNPQNSYEVATGGGDNTLRIWDIKNNKQKGFLMLNEDFRALDWSSNGKFIIIGSMKGNIYYVNTSDMKISEPFKSIFYSEEMDRKTGEYLKWIQELKISPDNSMVAYGSHCGKGKSFSKIQVLSITNDINNPFKVLINLDPKITSALTHLDWGTDNDHIVCNSLAFELKYVSIDAKSVVASSSCVYEKDLWHTWTCLFGFPVQGIWPLYATGYIVNYTCRSENQKVIATGDDFSLVKLFRCPSVIEHSEYKAYGGHSSHIPKVRFTPNDQYLISVGGNDKSVFIWETDFGKNINKEEEK